MLTLLKRLFGRKESPAPAETPGPAPAALPEALPTPPPVAREHTHAHVASNGTPQVAVAQLSLAAILDRFPADLREHIVKTPPATVTVALPLTTIHKQLANGHVKMSLASLQRQAPAGTFTALRTEDKRMVEVPLSEIFRHVDVQNLRRRHDQRRVEVPRSAPALFGDKTNPFAVAPIEEEDEPEETPTVALRPLTMPELADEPDGLPAPAAMPAAPAPLRFPEPAPKADTGRKEANAVPQGDVTLPVATLCESWPEPYRGEALALGEMQVALPAALLGPMLAKGKVSFTWAQLRGWIPGAAGKETTGAGETSLTLPLKVVAPAFIALSRPAPRRAAMEVDPTIPEYFGGADSEPKAAVPVEAETVPSPEPAATPEVPATPAVPEAPAPVSAPLAFRLAGEETAPAVTPSIEPAAAPMETVAPISAPEPAPPAAPAPAVAAAPATLAELFGDPGKTSWSAMEIIHNTARLPGVAGAVLALQEGLLVAASLPEEIKGDTVAAFLPQVFARLTHYTGEMKLGEVEDVLLTTGGAHFQAYRLGEVYLAVLGRAGAVLPWDALRLVVQELMAQAPK